MFNNNKILVVIPARGGSKGIPRKNIRLLNHNPLISYPINIAKSSEYVDDIVVSTDDSEISFIAEKFGADDYVAVSKEGKCSIEYQHNKNKTKTVTYTFSEN